MERLRSVVRRKGGKGKGGKDKSLESSKGGRERERIKRRGGKEGA